MLPTDNTGAVECLTKLIVSMPRSGVIYIQTDHAKAILKAGLENDDESVCKNAERARDNLLRRTHLSVID